MPLEKSKPRSCLPAAKGSHRRVAFLFFSCNVAALLQLLLLWSRRDHLVDKPNPTIPFPPALRICNVTGLNFDPSKMTADPRSITRAHIPPMTNGTTTSASGYAYGPFVAKSGSTSMTKSLQYANLDLTSLSIDALSEEELDQYHFLSVLRHPMERALAGYHQAEIFWHKNWIGKPISERRLTWWNGTCLNSTWTPDIKVVQEYPCRGTEPRTTTETRLRRLNDFLDEIHEKGFWDQHLMPITYLLASNRAGPRATYYDIRHVNTLTTIISQAAGKDRFYEFKYMQRGSLRDGMDWVFRWEELVGLGSEYELARSAVDKLCGLYWNDVECLPYDVPECHAKYE